LIDEAGERRQSLEIDTLADEGPEAVIARLAMLARQLAQEARIPLSSVDATGVGLPGALDLVAGRTIFLPNLPGRWPHVPVAAQLEEKLAHPVFILNDVRALTLGEKTFGAGRQVQHMVCLAIGTGIGGGTVVNGRLHLGNDGTAGEWGHQTVEPHGPRCGCGNYGCLEAVASGSAIAAMGMRAVRQGLTTQIRELAGGDLDRITPRLIADAAQAGDETAREIYERAGQYIGIAVANAIVGLAPQMVVIGGGVAQAGDLLLQPIIETVRRRVYLSPVEKVQIVPAGLGVMAGAMGAAEWGRLRLFGFETVAEPA
jgi:glucokinase